MDDHRRRPVRPFPYLAVLSAFFVALYASNSCFCQQNSGYLFNDSSGVPLSIDSTGTQIFTWSEQWHTAHARKKGSEGVRRPWVNWAARFCRCPHEPHTPPMATL